MLHHLSGWVALAGLIVGFTVGLTGMGGGALMTPILVLIFRVQPLAAVSSDLVVSLLVKPVGGLVHLRRGTVDKRLVGWLCLGSVPSAFAGVLVLRSLGDGAAVQRHVQTALGVALFLAVAMMVARAVLNVRRRSQKGLPLDDGGGRPADHGAVVAVRPLPTLLIGLLGGLLVGMTSVGSGSLIIVLLLVIYPNLRASELVGTDLVGTVPLVAAAALGHLLFGQFQFGLTTSLLVGALPGVYIGARLSLRVPGRVLRRALAYVLTATALKLLGAGNAELAAVVVLAAAVGPLLWRVVRRTGGFTRAGVGSTAAPAAVDPPVVPAPAGAPTGAGAGAGVAGAASPARPTGDGAVDDVGSSSPAPLRPALAP